MLLIVLFMLIFVYGVLRNQARCHYNLCVQDEKCSVREVRGNWCDWSTWSSCEQRTCTRLRRRVCACPQPTRFKYHLLCDTSRIQRDIIKNGGIKKHTRFIRKSTVGSLCEIPFYFNGRYFGDCGKISQGYVCILTNGEGTFCMNNQTDEMAEEDVGSCDGWKNYPHWALTGNTGVQKAVFSSESDLGQMCPHRTPIDWTLGCKLNLYFGENKRSDYGRLVDLAFNVDGCRLACAIHPQCQSLDFFPGYRCALYLSKVSAGSGLNPQVGNEHQTKPLSCVATQKPITGGGRHSKYEFSLVVDVIDTVRYGF